MTTIIRHESWIAEGSSATLDTAIDSAKADVLAYQDADTENYHAIDIYDLPRRGHWRVFSLKAASDLSIDEVIDLCCSRSETEIPDQQIINADTQSGDIYCTPVGMLRYGASELAQRSVNADRIMCEPSLLRNYILGEPINASDHPEDAQAAPVHYSGIVSALAEASREVDYYLALITNTPLSVAVPHIIRDATCRIARYRLARYEEGAEEESRVYRDYKMTIKMLEDVADKKRMIKGLEPLQTGADDSKRTAYIVKAPKAVY